MVKSSMSMKGSGHSALERRIRNHGRSKPPSFSQAKHFARQRQVNPLFAGAYVGAHVQKKLERMLAQVDDGRVSSAKLAPYQEFLQMYGGAPGPQVHGSRPTTTSNIMGYAGRAAAVLCIAAAAQFAAGCGGGSGGGPAEPTVVVEEPDDGATVTTVSVTPSGNTNQVYPKNTDFTIGVSTTHAQSAGVALQNALNGVETRAVTTSGIFFDLDNKNGTSNRDVSAFPDGNGNASLVVRYSVPGIKFGTVIVERSDGEVFKSDPIWVGIHDFASMEIVRMAERLVDIPEFRSVVGGFLDFNTYRVFVKDVIAANDAAANTFLNDNLETHLADNKTNGTAREVVLFRNYAKAAGIGYVICYSKIQVPGDFGGLTIRDRSFPDSTTGPGYYFVLRLNPAATQAFDAVAGTGLDVAAQRMFALLKYGRLSANVTEDSDASPNQVTFPTSNTTVAATRPDLTFVYVLNGTTIYHHLEIPVSNNQVFADVLAYVAGLGFPVNIGVMDGIAAAPGSLPAGVHVYSPFALTKRPEELIQYAFENFAPPPVSGNALTHGVGRLPNGWNLVVLQQTLGLFFGDYLIPYRPPQK